MKASNHEWGSSVCSVHGKVSVQKVQVLPSLMEAVTGRVPAAKAPSGRGQRQGQSMPWAWSHPTRLLHFGFLPLPHTQLPEADRSLIGSLHLRKWGSRLRPRLPRSPIVGRAVVVPQCLGSRLASHLGSSDAAASGTGPCKRTVIREMTGRYALRSAAIGFFRCGMPWLPRDALRWDNTRGAGPRGGERG